MKVHTLLMQDMVVPDLRARSREEVLKELVHFLKKQSMISKEKELYEKLLQRESLGSTAIGKGIAIPHCKMKGVKTPIVLLAISRKGVDFQSLDEKPSHIFFLVVSSPDNPSLNLQILASIAHLVRKAKPLQRNVLRAKSISRVLDVIREEELRIDE